MDIIKLKARPRTGTGKSYTRKVRLQGWIPAVYYGHSIKAQNIEVDSKEFGTILRGGKTTHLIDLGLADQGEDAVAVIKEIQREVLLPSKIEHIDFQHTSLNEEITMEIPIEIVGAPIGVVRDEGVLNHPMQTISVKCLARHIPEKIVVQVEQLEVGQSIHVKDLSVPNVTFESDPDEVVANVTRSSKVEEVAPVAAEGEAAEGAAAAPAAEGGAAAGKGAAGAKPAAGEAKGKEEKSGDKKKA